jgi:ABC-type transporter Mla subunit MlaD
MTDHLDGVLDTAVPLLKRVDEVLAATGAPADHELWPAVRRVRLLPWDAVQTVAGLRPQALAAAAPELRADARSYAGIADALPAPDDWTGDAADAYDTARRRTAQHLSGGLDSLDERLEATADLADALADWMRRARGDLATTLAEVLSSAEGLSLSSNTTVDPAAAHEAEAAASVAARILQTVGDSYDAAAELLDGSAHLAVPERLR